MPFIERLLNKCEKPLELPVLPGSPPAMKWMAFHRPSGRSNQAPFHYRFQDRAPKRRSADARSCT